MPTTASRRRARGSAATIEDATADLIGAYRRAEAELSAELARVTSTIVDPTSTRRYRAEQIRALRARVAVTRARLEGRASMFAERSMSRIYAAGMQRAQDALEIAGAPSFTSLHTRALEVLASDTFDDLAAATSYLEESTRSAIRQASKARTMAGALEGASVDRDRRQLVDNLRRQGVTGFVDASGRGWRLSSYAEMVVRTKSAQAYNTGTVLRAEETGTRVFVISDGTRSRHPECLVYDGTTCSSSWALANPVQHPNCVRSFGPAPLHRGPVDHGDPGTDRSAAEQVEEQAATRQATAPPVGPEAPGPDVGATGRPAASGLSDDDLAVLTGNAGAGATNEQARDALDRALGFAHGPYRGRVDAAALDADGRLQSWRLVLEDEDGNRVGAAARYVHMREGRRMVKHSRFEVDPSAQGQGLGTILGQRSEELYRRLGVEGIDLTANIDVGGYAWARAGYDYASADVARTHAGQMSRNLLVRRANELGITGPDGLPGPDRALYDRLQSIAASTSDDLADYATPFELSRIGFDDGDGSTWAGKELMLGTGWDGVKWL